MSRREVIEELHKPARKNFKRQRVIIKGLDDLWQADLVDMRAYSSENQGFCFLLTVIDTFSKYAWAVPIKRKSASEVVKAMKSLFNQRIPKNLQTDDGKEFFNKSFQKLTSGYGINHYSSYSALKASIVERFNRTLKNIMWKEFSMNGNYRWISMLDNLMEKYNTTKHRTIKMRPIDVGSHNEKLLLSTVYKYPIIKSKPKYRVGDFVRISRHKHVFEKGYTPNWSTEIFKIRRLKAVHPTTYTLEDYQGKIIQGRFYELELAPVKHPDLYLVEKILKRRGNMVFVKWLGFSSEHNNWINIGDIL